MLPQRPLTLPVRGDYSGAVFLTVVAPHEAVMHRPPALSHRALLAALVPAALALTVAVAPRGAAQPAPAPAAVPGAAAQARAEGIIRKIFKEEYDRAGRGPAAGKELSATLLQQART